MQARDLPGIVQAAYHLIPYFVFSPEEGDSSLKYWDVVIKGKYRKREIGPNYLGACSIFDVQVPGAHSLRQRILRSQNTASC